MLLKSWTQPVSLFLLFVCQVGWCTKSPGITKIVRNPWSSTFWQNVEALVSTWTGTAFKGSLISAEGIYPDLGVHTNAGVIHTTGNRTRRLEGALVEQTCKVFDTLTNLSSRLWRPSCSSSPGPQLSHWAYCLQMSWMRVKTGLVAFIDHFITRNALWNLHTDKLRVGNLRSTHSFQQWIYSWQIRRRKPEVPVCK